MGKPGLKYIFYLTAAVILLYPVFFGPAAENEPERLKTELNKIVPPENFESFSFTSAVIELSALVDPKMDKARAAQRIKRLASGLKKNIGQEGDPELIISKMNDFFFNKQGFTYDTKMSRINSGDLSAEDVTREDILNFHSIARVLKRKKAICLSMSVIYLMMGELLDMPLYGVLMPGHIYVRYKEKGRAGVNVETTLSGRGIYRYDRHYGLSILNEEISIYGKELGQYEIIGAYLTNLGNYHLVFGEAEKAAVFFKKSMEILPSLPESYANLGMVFLGKNEYDRAADIFEKGIEKSPGSYTLHMLAGEAYLAAGDFEKAETRAAEANRLYGRENGPAAELLKKIEEKKNAG